MRRIRRWVLTLAATAVSAYALDAIATACGVTLVALGWLTPLPDGPLLVFLVATYAFWAVGLRANLRANWLLLETMGTSTNAVSKAAYDMVGRVTRMIDARRMAAAAGYVSTELVKELPYYAGAFGAALVTGVISSSEAIIFLGGANLGAAGYEYALARMTRLAIRTAGASASG